MGKIENDKDKIERLKMPKKKSGRLKLIQESTGKIKSEKLTIIAIKPL